METLSSSATIASSSSPLSIFTPKRNLSTKKPSLLAVAQHDRRDDASDSEDNKLAPLRNTNISLSPLSKDAAMGLVLSAAAGRGWTTGSGMEGPSSPDAGNADSGTEQVSTFPWSLFTKSPRRRMRVAFTCNVCGQRTTRAINPHAYTDGTVFVQCCGCNVFHKLVDNLNLFHEMKCYISPSFRYKDQEGDVRFKFLIDEDDNDVFPLL